MSEVAGFEQQRLPRLARQSVGETITEIEPRRMAAAELTDGSRLANRCGTAPIR